MSVWTYFIIRREHYTVGFITISYEIDLKNYHNFCSLMRRIRYRRSPNLGQYLSFAASIFTYEAYLIK